MARKINLTPDRLPMQLRELQFDRLEATVDDSASPARISRCGFIREASAPVLQEALQAAQGFWPQLELDHSFQAGIMYMGGWDAAGVDMKSCYFQGELESFLKQYGKRRLTDKGFACAALEGALYRGRLATLAILEKRMTLHIELSPEESAEILEKENNSHA